MPAHLTKLTQIYPWLLNPPIISAPMRIMSGPALAVSVSRAGGLGFIGPGAKTSDTIQDLSKASTLLKQSWPSQTAPSPNTLPVGVGFQLWSDDAEIAVSGIEKYKPCAAWLFAPRGVEDFDSWSANIRRISPATKVWIQIGTVGEAVALRRGSERPDSIVIQGAEAGGHGRANDGMGLMALFPEVADVLAGSKIPLFAAGGIADARGAVAALGLGASGIVMGTRFLASPEARIARGYQHEIIRASDGATTTTRTLLYNHLRGTTGWPREYSPRTIVNRSWVEYQAGRSFEELKRLHDEALKDGDAGWGPEGRLATYAGAGVGLVREVKDAGEIVREVREGVRRLVRGML